MRFHNFDSEHTLIVMKKRNKRIFFFSGITCEPPYSEIENGVVNCTNANFVNSLCIFTCDTNFAIMGEAESICVESERDAIEGIWTFPPPTCFRKYTLTFIIDVIIIIVFRPS